MYARTYLNTNACVYPQVRGSNIWNSCVEQKCEWKQYCTYIIAQDISLKQFQYIKSWQITTLKELISIWEHLVLWNIILFLIVSHLVKGL